MRDSQNGDEKQGRAAPKIRSARRKTAKPVEIPRPAVEPQASVPEVAAPPVEDASVAQEAVLAPNPFTPSNEGDAEFPQTDASQIPSIVAEQRRRETARTR